MHWGYVEAYRSMQLTAAVTAAAPPADAGRQPVTRESKLSMSDLIRTTVEVQSNIAVNIGVYVSGNDQAKGTESAKVDVRVEERGTCCFVSS
jgi:hypothetical protein